MNATEDDDANAFLMGTGGDGTPWAKFPAPGTKVAGKVMVKPEKRQQLKYKTNEPLFWDDGKPRMEIVFRLDTGVTDPSVEDDDGVRELHAKGKMLKAIREAVLAVGAPGVEPGSYLAVEHTHKDGDFKEYRAEYTPPAPGADEGNVELMGGSQSIEQVAVNAPLATAQLAQATASDGAPLVAGSTAQGYELIPPCPPGIPPAKWQAMTPDQRMVVSAAIAAQGDPATQAAPPGAPQATTSPPF